MIPFLVTFSSNVSFQYSEYAGLKAYDEGHVKEGVGAGGLMLAANFYKDIELDYEDDQWILQYQKTPGDIGEPEELPILRYGDWWFKNIISILGKDNFERLLGEWFTDIYGLPVKTVKVEE